MHNMNLSPEELVSAIASYPAPKQAWAWHYYAAKKKKRVCITPMPSKIANHPIASSKVINRMNIGSRLISCQDRACYFPYEMMVKLDRMTMAHSVEGRAPLVAPGILNFVEDLSFDQLVRGDVLKPILREAFEGYTTRKHYKTPQTWLSCADRLLVGRGVVGSGRIHSPRLPRCPNTGLLQKMPVRMHTIS